MARGQSKQSLQELQARLAERLLAVRSDNVDAAQWLAVQAGAGNYLIPLVQAGEIFPWSGVQTVPYAQAWFLGVASLRGNLLGVIDLSALLKKPVERTQQSLQETSLLVVNPVLQVNAALVVDRLLGLRSGEALELLPSAASPSGPGLGQCWRDAQGQEWQELNLQSLVQSPEFLRVSQ